MMTIGEIIGIWVAAGLTLVFFSFIYKDNVVFKFGEHLYLGISIGYYVNVQYWNVLVPDVYRNVAIEHNYWVLIPALLGLFILLRVVPSLAWLSRTSFAFYIGGFAGLSVPYILNNLFFKQLSETLRPMDAWATMWGANLNLLVILVGVFATLIFFFFSLEHRKAVGAVSKVGLFFIMVSFGTSFGNTVMARVSLLIGRFQFLLTDFGGMLKSMFGGS